MQRLSPGAALETHLAHASRIGQAALARPVPPKCAHGVGAKLFYLSGMRNGHYLKREVLNLARFISIMKLRPLAWRTAHPYLLTDRFEVGSRHMHEATAPCTHFQLLGCSSGCLQCRAHGACCADRVLHVHGWAASWLLLQ